MPRSKEEQKKYDAAYYQKNKNKIKARKVDYHVENRDKINAYVAGYHDDLRQCVEDYIRMGEILDLKKWDQWCNNTIRNGGKQNNKPYSDDFTNEIIFDKMSQGCFYCGDIATTIDRLDSALSHTLINCVGCCWGCNNSKGTADPTTFIKKAYYRVYGKYIDDDDKLWFVHKKKPQVFEYKTSAEKKDVPYDLKRDYFNALIKGKCYYCERIPTTWFGIDRVVPSEGYVCDNVVPCCFDCNLDKHTNSIKDTIFRNKNIVKRLDNGYFNLEELAKKVPKTILHKGSSPDSKKVCAYGKVYRNKSEASRSIGKSYTYVSICIRDGKYMDDIFDISDDFYDEYKDIDMYITKTMCIGFEHFYVNDD